ncbi:MAG: M55 family metallopeptidase [Candidatus Aminicenantes bacterium]|nr:MAG: M55 family metallopeptidase [Candidatus Aminicenantes bacterium]
MKKGFIFIFIIFLSMFLITAEHTYGQEKLKVYISVDMEGIAGVVNGEQTSASGGDYGIARRWMTQEVNAAIRGALEAGATEIVVNDSHGSMRNVIISELDSAASLITGSPKPLSMMHGIDETFDAIFLIGYHARAGSEDGVLDHTYSGGSVYSIKVNGKELGESEQNALIAGCYDVPIVLVTGDKTVCGQVKKSLGEEVETAVVKEGIGRYAAKSLTPTNACTLIQKKAKIALENRNKVKPLKLQSPYRFELTYMRSSMAEAGELIPQVKRTGPRTVMYEVQDYIEGYKLFRALVGLAR